uniref:Uncharacterized protein n=1 Tax=Panagrolaimus sp. PS1159 TaxID=55785 RepID=A0AC35GSB0_9BILA
MPMTLGILNLPSEIFHDGYNMTEYGFPIFYEYEKHLWLKVYLIIANGKKTKYNGGSYYYVYLFDEGKKCKSNKPQFGTRFGEMDTLSGGLYLNQRNASYAYFIYQSRNATCIFTIEFKDLFQGDYATKQVKKITPKQVNLIKKNEFQGNYATKQVKKITPKQVNLIKKTEVKDFYYPFFSIDPLLGMLLFYIIIS